MLAPLASNASELIASYNYAKKKTQKTISVSLAALEGAACMNNTFCLSIFMGLVFFKGLAWKFSAETLSILVVEARALVDVTVMGDVTIRPCYVTAETLSILVVEVRRCEARTRYQFMATSYGRP